MHRRVDFSGWECGGTQTLIALVNGFVQIQRLLESRSFLYKSHKGCAGNGILEANFVYILYALKAN